MPPTIRLFVLSSSSAFPGSILSGECATNRSSPGVRPDSLSIGSIRSVTGLGGDVDSRTTIAPGLRHGVIVLVADSTNLISAVLSGLIGVGTEMIYTSLPTGHSVEPTRCPSATACFTMSPRKGSSMIVSPLLRASIAFSFTSYPTT